MECMSETSSDWTEILPVHTHAKPSFVDLLAVQQLDWSCLVHIIIQE